MKKVFLNKFFVIVVGVIAVVFYMPRLSAADKKVDTKDVVDMIVGDIQTVSAHNLTRVSVTDPDVADISDAQSDTISLLAKKSGQTTLFLWDTVGKHSIKIRVVSEDLNALKERLQKLLEEAGVTDVTFEQNLDIGKLVATGSLSKEDKGRMADVIGPYSDNLLNLVKEDKNQDLIEVDMQVVEINTTLEKNLGIVWGIGSSSATTITTASGASTPGQNVTTGTQLSVPFSENQPLPQKGFQNMFKIGSFSRDVNAPITATVNALLQEGKARLISKPRLVVVSGKQASFLVGGEIPIQNSTTTASGGATTSSTTYSQYGVNMTVSPTIIKGKIDIVLNVDIRDVDNSSSFSTNSNIAFITRTASTELMMDNKQTIALAGLIKYQDSVSLNEVPFLAKIPLVGALFRDRNEPADNSTEMVIILTPVVLSDKRFAEKQVVIPTPSEREYNSEINKKYEHEALPTWPVVKPSLETPSFPVVPQPPQPITVFKIVPDNNIQSVLPEMTAYARMVQEKISKAIIYPPEINGKTLTGTVKLKLCILKDGVLSSEEVMESSGNDVLDRDALQAAKAAAPYDAFTRGIRQKDLIFTVPIVYNKLIPGGRTSSEKVIAAY